jgi:ribosomal small subunit protein bTHX
LLFGFIFLLLQQLIKTMGKGDKRSKRGKIHIGSYGRTRPKKKAAKKAAAAAKKGKAAPKKAKKTAK